MIKTINGNILDYDKDIIVQQVNCQGVMGGGLASQILNQYPEVPMEYKKHYKQRRSSAIKTAELLGEVQFVDVYDGKVIANVFGQDRIRGGYQDKTVYTEYWALKKGLEQVKEYALANKMSVAIPTYIGCGLANGDWDTVKDIINEVFDDNQLDVTLYHYGR